MRLTAGLNAVGKKKFAVAWNRRTSIYRSCSTYSGHTELSQMSTIVITMLFQLYALDQ
jgi:hypothetical protein